MKRDLAVEAAVERYLKERRGNVSDSTLYNHSSQLRQFVKWCEDKDEIETIGDIDAWHIADFRLYRGEELPSSTTHYNQMSMLRVFIRWCESRGLLDGLSENIIMPERESKARETRLSSERGEELLTVLQKYDYASFQHVLFTLMWTTGVRVGAARALDLQDVHIDDKYIDIHHRPETDTPLKNTNKSERQVNLHDWVTVILEDYIEDRRIEVTDDHGREPLFTTRNGRAHTTTLRKRIRALTRPCEFSGECPYDRDIDDCEATKYSLSAQCPGSVSPHPLRRASITNFLNEGHSKQLVSERTDVSVGVLEKHYDVRDQDDKRELRREKFGMD